MRYVDTSVLVAALTNESDTQAAQQDLTEAPIGELLISDWTLTEFSAALAAKSRAGFLGDGDRRAAHSAFAELLASALTRIEVTSSHFVAAAHLAGNSTAALRAGDALHLAVAAGAGATMHTLDKGLHRAAAALDLSAVLVSSAEESALDQPDQD